MNKQGSLFYKEGILKRFDEKEIISNFTYDEILAKFSKKEIYQKYSSDEILESAKQYADQYTEGFITTYCIKGKWYTRFGMDGEIINKEKLKEMAEGTNYFESVFNALYSEIFETETYYIEYMEANKVKNTRKVKEIKRIPYLTTGEAEEKWHKPKGTIRNLIHRGKLESEIEKGLIKRTGKLWMVDEKLMYDLYGEPKETGKRLVNVK